MHLSTLQGSPVVVNFFASTCVPCITEMPALEEVHAEFGDRVEFLGLAVFDRPEEAQRLVEQTGVTYPTAQDKDGTAIEALGGTMLPTTVLLDADGKDRPHPHRQDRRRRAAQPPGRRPRPHHRVSAP